MNNIVLKILIISFICLLNACDAKKKVTEDDNTILIGTIAGPETELVEVAKEVAKNKYNLTVFVVPFNDYVEPNRALAEGEINANLFQHKPYLDHVVVNQKLALSNIANMFIYPMGVYSRKYNKIANLPERALIAIASDASNQARGLLLLEKAGLIKLNNSVNNSGDINITKKDIISNPKKLQFMELDPALMARMLQDVDLAIINTNYAVLADLLPNRDALIIEDKSSKYANVLVVRTEDRDQEKFKKLIKALQSEEVLNKATQLFYNQAIKAW